MRIALTGGIAAGKSTVSRRLQSLGAYVIDYDELSRAVIEPGSVALQRIVSRFGSAALDAKGRLNRSWMASQVFAPGHEREKKALEAIIHPQVYAQAARLEEQMLKQGHASGIAKTDADSSADARGSAAPSIIVHEIPLLAEVAASIPFDFEHVISVEAPVDTRVTRMVEERHMSQRDALNRVNSQATRYEREGVADIIIDSSEGIEQMFERVDTVYEELSEQAV